MILSRFCGRNERSLSDAPVAARSTAASAVPCRPVPRAYVLTHASVSTVNCRIPTKSAESDEASGAGSVLESDRWESEGTMISPHWKPERLCRILLAHDIELPIRKSLRVHRSDPRRQFVRPAILTGLLAALAPEFIDDDILRAEL